uniref:Oxysterol-binding protein n=1 Tax=Macrostomum lignano TaxID=282301 RepID=A0A1I8JR21_9PLAT
AAAFHVESKAGWIAYQEFGMSSKFRGKFLSVIPHGIAHLVFAESGHHYTWLALTYKPLFLFLSAETPRKVTGVITDRQGAKPVMETRQASVLWRRNPNLPNADKMYNFTKFAIEMKRARGRRCATDSRLRPDQRLMEDGRWDEANKEKLRLEEKQRAKRPATRGHSGGSSRRTQQSQLEDRREQLPVSWVEAMGPQSSSRPVVQLQQDEITGNSIHPLHWRLLACKEASGLVKVSRPVLMR